LKNLLGPKRYLTFINSIITIITAIVIMSKKVVTSYYWCYY